MIGHVLVNTNEVMTNDYQMEHQALDLISKIQEQNVEVPKEEIKEENINKISVKKEEKMKEEKEESKKDEKEESTKYDNIVQNKKVQKKEIQINKTEKTVNIKNEYLENINYNYYSIVDALKEIEIDSSFEYRSKLALKNGIKNYKGTASQNLKLLKLLKNGKLLSV